MSRLPALIPVTGRYRPGDDEPEIPPDPGACGWSRTLSNEDGYPGAGHGGGLLTISGMCLHEHDLTIELCPTCVRYLRELAEDDLVWCRACYSPDERIMHLCSPGVPGTATAPADSVTP